ncbi:MAG: hypothetical protein HFG43_06925 [Lachnospiraceae bacterium]|jgi:hypothetical protein|nr:hypothetical protein [Lachnospiraceae bacterium]MCI9589464.1 hypothetical protein [Lachnospiraceae bacterium]
MKVKLDVILDAIEMADDNYTYFLDLETGESVFLADELVTGLDNEGLEDEIEENLERYLRLPTKFEIHEYHIMEEFIWTLKGDRADKLEHAIQGRGAFRRFKDMVDRMGISQQWYDFQAEYYRKLAIEWCQEHGLEYIEESV